MSGREQIFQKQKEIFPMTEKIIRMDRTTRETSIELALGDQGKQTSISTPIPIFTHFLEQLAFYSGWTLQLKAEDVMVCDDHHLVEDVAIVLGRAVNEYLGSRDGILRFGQRWLPMDDALALAVVDLGGRFWLEWSGSFPRNELGGLAIENIRHFFYSLADAARMTLHIRVEGINTHHMAEAVFKAVGMALQEGGRPWLGGQVRSTKGVLA
jgi:imidazoleglycerol phosphate dehydratase HisB